MWPAAAASTLAIPRFQAFVLLFFNFVYLPAQADVQYQTLHEIRHAMGMSSYQL
jgi:hypothetical protein